MLGSTTIADNRITGGDSMNHQTELVGAVCWKAILAGAIGASAISLLLLLLGLGLGLSPNFPWSFQSLAITGTTALIWIALTQLAGSSFGGFISGYLASNLAAAKKGGACFRYAIQGLLTWAVATLLSIAALFWVGGLIANGLLETSKIGSNVVGSAVEGKALMLPKIGLDDNSVNYISDMLMRSDQEPGRDKESDGRRKQIGRILAENADSEKMDSEDRDYLVRIVSKSQKLSQSDAERIVDDAYGQYKKLISKAQNKSKQVVEEARKLLSKSALWIYIVFTLGMLSSILLSVFGGRRQAAFLNNSVLN